MVPAGEIIDVRDEGAVWQIVYKIADDGLGVVNFDWRMLARMYEAECGGSFANVSTSIFETRMRNRRRLSWKSKECCELIGARSRS